MQYKVTVKPANKSLQGWNLEHAHFHNPPHGHGPLSQVDLVDWSESDDGVFEVRLNLPSGINVLFFNMALNARKLEVDMSPRPTITQGPDRDWTVTLETPFTHDIQTIVIRVGGDE